MYNKVIMLGRITHDLELKTTPSGASVLSFSIAVDRRYQAKGEEKKTDFFNCVAWRNEADFISRFWTKGKAILIEGELQGRSYVDKNGVTRYVTEIIVDRACFTGDSTAKAQPAAPGEPPQSGNIPRQSGNTPGTYEPPKTYTAEDFVLKAEDDDYPF